MLLVLLAGGNALAQTENADGSQTLWETVMTPGTNTVTFGPTRTELLGYSVPSGYGSFSSVATFRYNPTDYTVDVVQWIREFENDVLDSYTVKLRTTPIFPFNDRNRLVLQLDNSPFLFSDGTRQVNFDQWDADDLDWSEDRLVTVKLIRLNPPKAPTGLTAKAGDGEVTLTWETPGDGGSAITKHQLRGKTTGNYGPWTDIPNSAAGEARATTTTGTGLTNGTEYTFEVRAVNA